MPTAYTLERSPVPAEPSPERSAQPRYLALDAYRGFIMLILVSGGFGLAELAKRRPAFTGIANQFDHMTWEWIAKRLRMGRWRTAFNATRAASKPKRTKILH